MKNLAGNVSHLLLAGILVMTGCSGDKGDPGAKGATGDAGIPGKSGAIGATGAPGPTGPTGPTGATGATGTSSTSSDAGTGTPGKDGAPGATGATGATGPAGATGATGANGATGDAGTSGKDGDPGTSTAPLTLTITNSITGAGISGVKITLSPASSTTLANTDSSGKTSGIVPIGSYSTTIAANGYTSATQIINVAAGVSESLSVKLVPAAKVVANAGADITGQAPGATVNLNATSTVYDGSNGATYAWTQVSGPTVTLTGASTANPSLTVPSVAAMQTALIDDLTAPTDVQSATNDAPLRRLDILGLNPHSLEEATIIGLQVTVTTSSGTYTDTVNVTANAPFQVTSGLRNVPIGIPQLFQAGPLPTGTGAPTAWNWTVDVSKATGSAATIQNATTQFPLFTPDVTGTYVLSEASTGGKLTLYAGTWSTGAIDSTNVDANDKPLPKAPTATCGNCHDDRLAANKWADWSKTGHAVIVPENIDVAGGHWSFTSCGQCHSVGYNTTVNNGGADDAYQAILNKESTWTIPMGSPGELHAMLTSTDPTAGDQIKAFAGKLNVQCENCHGPTNSDGHKTTGFKSSSTTWNATDQGARVSLKAEVCGQCHGEPQRHGRYQQWQESKHANTTLAEQRGAADGSSALPTAPASDTTNCNAKCQQTWANQNNNGNHCARCHTGEGWVIWQDQSSDDMNFNNKIQGASGDATLTEVVGMGLVKANVHSQTCATCHDPHDVGMTAQEQPFVDPTTGKATDPTKNNTTNVRVMGDIAMLPAGFPAIGLGKGALCSTCHNSRNGVHNDSNTYIAPGQVTIGSVHDSTAAEVVLGQNMYFVTPGQRGGHSYIQDTCVHCHMELSPQPANFSYPGTGTNHSFAADVGICVNCHGNFDGGSIQDATKASLTNLLNFIGDGIKKKFAALGANSATKTIWALARRNMTDATAAYSHAAAANTAAPNQISNAYTDITPYNIMIDLSANPVKSVSMIEDNTTFQVTLTNPISITWVDSKGNTLTSLGTNGVESVSSFYVSLSTMRADNGSGTGPSTLLDGTECPISQVGNVNKALWNYISLYREGSWGIHNPGFTNTVIGATMSQDLTK